MGVLNQLWTAGHHMTWHLSHGLGCAWYLFDFFKWKRRTLGKHAFVYVCTCVYMLSWFIMYSHTLVKYNNILNIHKYTAHSQKQVWSLKRKFFWETCWIAGKASDFPLPLRSQSHVTLNCRMCCVINILDGTYLTKSTRGANPNIYIYYVKRWYIYNWHNKKIIYIYVFIYIYVLYIYTANAWALPGSATTTGKASSSSSSSNPYWRSSMNVEVSRGWEN